MDPYSADIHPGGWIFGRFLLREKVADSSLGDLWRAQDNDRNATVILRLLPKIVARDKRAMLELAKVFEQASKLRHENIAAPVDFFSTGEAAVVTSDDVRGQTLKDILMAHPHGYFEADEISPWVEQILNALHYAYEEHKLLHRDLRPSGISILEGDVVRMREFALSRRLAELIGERSGFSPVTRTILYQSPQQLSRKIPRHQDDLYAVGCLIFELLTGTPPFPDGNIQERHLREAAPSMMERRRQEQLTRRFLEIPARWERAVALALSKDVQSRPASAQEFLQILKYDQRAGEVRIRAEEGEDESSLAEEPLTEADRPDASGQVRKSRSPEKVVAKLSSTDSAIAAKGSGLGLPRKAVRKLKLVALGLIPVISVSSIVFLASALSRSENAASGESSGSGEDSGSTAEQGGSRDLGGLEIIEENGSRFVQLPAPDYTQVAGQSDIYMLKQAVEVGPENDVLRIAAGDPVVVLSYVRENLWRVAHEGRRFAVDPALLRQAETDEVSALREAHIQSGDHTNAPLEKVELLESPNLKVSDLEWSRAHHQVVNYLESRSWKERLPYVRHSARVAPLMEVYYQNRDDGPVSYTDIEYAYRMELEGMDLLMITAVKTDYSELSFTLVNHGNGDFKIDWEILVEYSPLSFERFRQSLPDQPMPFRVQLRSADYYNFEFRDKEVYRSYEVWTATEFTGLHAYVRRDAPFFKELEFLPADTPCLSIVSLQYSEQPESDSVVEMVEFLQRNWVIAKPDSRAAQVIEAASASLRRADG